MDVRETIILRLMEICETVSGLTVFRNRTTLAEDARPCVVVVDGDETSDDRDNNRGGLSPRRITMTPSIYILAEDDVEDIGSLINTLRARIVYAVLSDKALTAYTVNNLGPVYTGIAMAVENGRKMSGTMELQFALTYLLLPSDLAA